MNCSFNHVAVSGIAAVVPSQCLHIEDELSFFQGNPKKLERAKKIIGYGTRHIVPEGVTAVDLCEAAARKLFDETGHPRDSIDALILVNQSPDHFHPSGSCILHGRLGLPKTCVTLDISLGCSGYVHGLWLAHSLIASNAAHNVLLLAGDTPSLHSDRRNRLVNPLFGDAGTATWLCRTERENSAFFNLGSDGTGWQHIAIPAGGFRIRPDAAILGTEYSDGQGNPWKLTESLISGMDVFDFTLHEVPSSIREVMEHAGLGVESIDFFALHQANKQIIQAIGDSLRLPPEKISWQTFSKYGNQSTASVACVLCDVLAKLPPANRNTLLLSGFGVGLSWASAVISWQHVQNAGVSLWEPAHHAPTREEQISFWKHKHCGTGE